MQLAAPLGTLDALNGQLMVDAGKAGRLMTFNTFSDPFLPLANQQVDAVIADEVAPRRRRAAWPSSSSR